MKEENKYHIDSLESQKMIEKKEKQFLILGIVLSFCCNMPFGIAIILLNEFKYKVFLRNENIKEANYIRNLMIVLFVVGIILGFLYIIFMFLIDDSHELL